MSDDKVVVYQVDPGKVFQKALQDAIEQVSDLTIPFILIAKSWFKGNQAIFQLQGPGKYVDLSKNYKKEKMRAVGFVYPILKRNGAIEQSITNPGDSNAINLIINKTTLLLGTKVSYAAAHQDGAPKINLPQRPVLFIGAEQTAPPELNARRDAWIQIIQNYVEQVSLQFANKK